MNLEIFNNLINNAKKSDFVKNFINELNNFLEKNNNTNKYSKYWEEQKFLEDSVSATIGISRRASDITYKKELRQAVDESILELVPKEGTLYRKKFKPNGPNNNLIYKVEKFENGRVEQLFFSADKVPKGFDNKDIIFQYKEDGTAILRMDLKEKIVKEASRKTEYLKEKENEKALDYKKEGHVYSVVEDDGYIFLKDLTEKREYIVEDIDFIVDCYQGEGKYKVINGEYKKVN